MKIALCLNGLVGNKKRKSFHNKDVTTQDKLECLKLAAKTWQRHVFDLNNIDVFIHSWEVDIEKEIRTFFNPKKYKFEPQIIFDIEHKPNTNRTQAHYSRWYGVKQAVNLKLQYEEENNFEYDAVIVSRFDLAWSNNLILSEYDMKYFYVNSIIIDGQWWGFPKSSHAELMDYYFYSNSNYIDHFSLLYDNLGKYNLSVAQWNEMSNHALAYAHLKSLGIIPDFCLEGQKVAGPHGVALEDDYCQTIRREYFKETLRPGKECIT